MSNTTINGVTVRTYTHDAAGNLTVDQQGADTYTTTYNVRNRPTQVVRTGSASATSTYVYNGLEQMVTRTTNAVGGPTGAVYYYYDLAGNLIGEGNATAIQREYVWLPQDAGDTGASALPLALVTAVTTTPVISMVHADHLNRPIRMTSAAKAAVWSASWKPFGEPQALSATIENNLRFPGQYFLIETNQAYNWHRTYDPTTGRYTQPDPLRFVDGPSVYGYVGGSPYMRVDREGRDFWVEGSVSGEGGHPFHQSVCVGKYTGGRLCISFGVAEDNCVFGCKGAVYEDTSPAGDLVPNQFQSTSATQDEEIRQYFNSLIRTPGKYYVVGHNCRDFVSAIYEQLCTKCSRQCHWYNQPTQK